MLDATSEILKRRNLETGGLVQQTIDSEVIRYCDLKVPMDTGMLKDSAISATDIGTGEVIYNTPYARKQYYENSGTGQRGKLWFERMKADNLDDILRTAANISGSEAKK